MKSGMNVLRALLFVGFMVIALASESAAASERSSTDQDIVEGTKLSEEDAQLLEDTLKHHPEDLSTRNKLLAYYSRGTLRMVSQHSQSRGALDYRTSSGGPDCRVALRTVRRCF